MEFWCCFLQVLFGVSLFWFEVRFPFQGVCLFFFSGRFTTTTPAPSISMVVVLVTLCFFRRQWCDGADLAFWWCKLNGEVVVRVEWRRIW
jgi:hypothetical protein